MPARRALVAARRVSHPGRRPHPHVDVEVVDGVAVLALDDGKVNAISARAARVLTAALDRVQDDERVHALVFTGRPGQFCAGFDLDVLMVGGKRRDELVRDGWAVLGRLITLPLPVVVACTGNAVALGAALVLAGDVRLGADGEVKIGFNEAAIGVPLPGAMLVLVADRLHEDAFEEATHGARLYRPREALAAGFLHRVVAPAELLDAAIAEARALSSQPGFRRDKQARVDPMAERMRRQLPKDLALIERIGA
ncbi:MAG: crotonase/enoyl-CoA hydratase family protein [Solirubrobacteraceae bacterium]